MVDPQGRQERNPMPLFNCWSVGYYLIEQKTYTPATVCYNPETDIVLFVVHATEPGKNGELLATVNPTKVALATYNFFKAVGFDDLGHPVFDYSLFTLIKWNGEKPKKREIHPELFELGQKFVSIQEEIKDLLRKRGHVSFDG